MLQQARDHGVYYPVVPATLERSAASAVLQQAVVEVAALAGGARALEMKTVFIVMSRR
jgi:hypothetical protein